ncbi:MAG: LAGLIDADG family homing endonuclease [Nanoarchaeota archaeon]
MTDISNTAYNHFISIEDIPKEKFFILIKPKFNKKIITNLINKYGSLQNASHKINVSFVSLYNWRRTNQYPFSYLVSILKNLNCNTYPKINDNLINLRSGFNLKANGGGISSPIYPKLPIKLSKELVRIISHTFGDGCLSNTKSHLELTYYNQCSVLREQFKQDMNKIFGKIKFKEGINKTTPFVRVPVPIPLLLLTKIKNFNSKTCRVPYFIKNSRKYIKKEFLKSFFDDEGHVRYKPPYRRIELTLCNKPFLLDIKKLLEEFNIKTTKVYYKQLRGFDTYTVYIRNFHHLKSFYEFINFNHPLKLNKLEKIMKNPGRKHYTRIEVKNKILKYLENKDLTSSELMKMLDRKRVTVNLWLLLLEKEGKIYRKEIRKINKNNREIIWAIK